MSAWGTQSFGIEQLSRLARNQPCSFLSRVPDPARVGTARQDLAPCNMGDKSLALSRELRGLHKFPLQIGRGCLLAP